MYLNHDIKSDVLTLKLGQDNAVESRELEPGVLAYYAASGQLVGLEIQNASSHQFVENLPMLFVQTA